MCWEMIIEKGVGLQSVSRWGRPFPAGGYRATASFPIVGKSFTHMGKKLTKVSQSGRPTCRFSLFACYIDFST